LINNAPPPIAALELENPMGELSSSSTATEPVEAPLMELIQLYRVEQAMLLAHQREVERRRAAVRTAAEREASEILLAARREIRRVLVRTRHELAALTAQVRAAGCEPPSGESGPPIVSDDFQVSAARDVRDVLRDARSELADLSKEAVNLWPAGEQPLLPAAAVSVAVPPEPAAADDVASTPAYEERESFTHDLSEQAPANGPAEQFVVVRWRSAQVPATTLVERIQANWRIAAVALAILAVVVIAILALRPSSRTEAAVTPSRPDSVEPTTQGPATQEPSTQAAATAGNASAAAIGASERVGSGLLSLALEVRRPVWLRINTDGGDADPGRMYQPGERRTIQATREIVMRAGDAGAVFVSVGGAAPVALGPDGQVRTRRFAHEEEAATDRASQGPPPARGADVPPLPQAFAGAVAAGTEPAAPLPATVDPEPRVSTSTADRPDHVVTAADYAAAAEREILERHQRWFDAFLSGDRATMASLAADNFSLMDQRPERAPVAGRVERTIDDLRVQVTAGIGAVVSGRIVETTSTNEPLPVVTVAMFSEVWIRQREEWLLVSVRLVPLNAVSSPLQ
jgi:hypothetical protein